MVDICGVSLYFLINVNKLFSCFGPKSYSSINHTGSEGHWTSSLPAFIPKSPSPTRHSFCCILEGGADDSPCRPFLHHQLLCFQPFILVMEASLPVTVMPTFEFFRHLVPCRPTLCQPLMVVSLIYAFFLEVAAEGVVLLGVLSAPPVWSWRSGGTREVSFLGEGLRG